MLKVIAVFLTCIFIGLAGFPAESHQPEKAEEWVDDIINAKSFSLSQMSEWLRYKTVLGPGERKIFEGVSNVLSLPEGEEIEPQAAMNMKEKVAKIAQEVLGKSLFNQSAKELLRFYHIRRYRRFLCPDTLRPLDEEIAFDDLYAYTAYRLSGHRIIIKARVGTPTEEMRKTRKFLGLYEDYMSLLIFCAKEGAEKASDAMLPERVADAIYHEVDVTLLGEEEFALMRKEEALIEKGLLTREEAFAREPIGIHLRGILIHLTRPFETTLIPHN